VNYKRFGRQGAGGIRKGEEAPEGRKKEEEKREGVVHRRAAAREAGESMFLHNYMPFPSGFTRNLFMEKIKPRKSRGAHAAQRTGK